MKNLQEQVKKVFCYQKLFCPFTVWINCSSDLETFANSRPSAWNFERFSRSLGQFFVTVSQNNFGNKLPLELSQSWPEWCSTFGPSKVQNCQHNRKRRAGLRKKIQAAMQQKKSSFNRWSQLMIVWYIHITPELGLDLWILNPIYLVFWS